MKYIPSILSLLYKSRIKDLCRELHHIGHFKYFVNYIVFNNGKKFVLSNIFHMLTAYYAEELYKQDFSFHSSNTSNHTHFLCKNAFGVTENFAKLLEERFGVYRAYYIIRNAPECQFIFGAIKGHAVERVETLYESTLHRFEDFCCEFVDGTVDIIKQYNPAYATSIILNDPLYRQRIIKTEASLHEKLTLRELECLHWAAYGKSSKETARILSIKPLTVEGYRNEVKRKLGAETMAQAVFEAIKLGYLGTFNHLWEEHEPIVFSPMPSGATTTVRKSLKNNLWFLNHK